MGTGDKTLSKGGDTAVDNGEGGGRGVEGSGLHCKFLPLSTLVDPNILDCHELRGPPGEPCTLVLLESLKFGLPGSRCIDSGRPFLGFSASLPRDTIDTDLLCDALLIVFARPPVEEGALGPLSRMVSE